MEKGTAPDVFTMTALRPLTFTIAALIVVAVIVLAAQGGQENGRVLVSEPTSRPSCTESHESDPAVRECLIARSRTAVRNFIDNGDDPCSLPHTGVSGHSFTFRYLDRSALVNDSDLIIIGSPSSSFAGQPAPATGAARMYTAFQVDTVLVGTKTSTSITVDSRQGVYLQGNILMRSSVTYVPDFCIAGRMLLYLSRAALPDIYEIIIAAPDFEGYATERELIDDVREVAAELRAQGLPRGLLFCQSKRAAEVYDPPIVCPGESFNPYRALHLDMLAQGNVTTFEPGGGGVRRATVDLAPADSRATRLLATLDVDVTLESGEAIPNDAILLYITVAPPDGRRRYSMWYSPGSGSIQLLNSDSQFPAPPAFQLAMESFLATAP